MGKSSTPFSSGAQIEAFEKGKPALGIGDDRAVVAYADSAERVRTIGSTHGTTVRACGIGSDAFRRADEGMIVLNEAARHGWRLFDPFDVDLDHLDGGNAGQRRPCTASSSPSSSSRETGWKKGQRLAIVEAMKMEHALVAPADGEVAEMAAEPGAQVAEGARLIVLKTEEQDCGGSSRSRCSGHMIDIADVSSSAQTLRRLRFDRGPRRMDRGKPRSSPAAGPTL